MHALSNRKRTLVTAYLLLRAPASLFLFALSLCLLACTLLGALLFSSDTRDDIFERVVHYAHAFDFGWAMLMSYQYVGRKIGQEGDALKRSFVVVKL